MSTYATVPPEELRDVGLSAHALLLIESARLYGLVVGGPEVNVDRCIEIVAAAERVGCSYTDDEVDVRVLELVGEVAETVRSGSPLRKGSDAAAQ